MWTFLELKMTSSIPNKRVLRSKHVVGRVKLSRSGVYELVKKDQFPKPFKLVQGGRASGWLESDIDEWIDSRASKRGEQV